MAYFSNGSEGMVFDDECMDCPAAFKTCPVSLVQSLYNYDQVGNDTASRILDHLVTQQDGKYIGCQMKRVMDEVFKEL